MCSSLDAVVCYIAFIYFFSRFKRVNMILKMGILLCQSISEYKILDYNRLFTKRQSLLALIIYFCICKYKQHQGHVIWACIIFWCPFSLATRSRDEMRVVLSQCWAWGAQADHTGFILSSLPWTRSLAYSTANILLPEPPWKGSTSTPSVFCPAGLASLQVPSASQKSMLRRVAY